MQINDTNRQDDTDKLLVTKEARWSAQLFTLAPHGLNKRQEFHSKNRESKPTCYLIMGGHSPEHVRTSFKVHTLTCAIDVSQSNSSLGLKVINLPLLRWRNYSLTGELVIVSRT